MATVFLDTSALVKRYVAEAGHVWIADQCKPESGNSIVIAQATLAEAVAAFCRRAFDRSISEAERDRLIGLFRRDVRRGYTLERVTTAIYTRAGDLCRTHRMRAYDAVQLACALALRDKLAPLGLAPLFLSADTALLGFASTEVLPTANPNIFP